MSSRVESSKKPYHSQSVVLEYISKTSLAVPPSPKSTLMNSNQNLYLAESGPLIDSETNQLIRNKII